MPGFLIAIIVVLAVLVPGIVVMIVKTMPIAKMVFRTQFTRPENAKAGWTRGECSFPDNEENMEMHRQGMAWAEENKGAMREVSIINDGLKLCGQYFDFGFEKAAIFLAGRAEPCTYSYYFAMPYKEFGYNVLVIDNRSTGWSEGEYSSAGMKEYGDVTEWIKYLHDELLNKKVLIHGICIGSATGLRAVTHGDLPYVEALIADGMYESFYETLRTHFIELGKPVFPVCYEVVFMVYKLTGKNVMTEGPKKDIKKLDIPFLMIHGREDVFSLPAKAEKMFASCPSNHKKLVWFEEGMHSHLKIRAPKKYDETVKEFIDTL
ncbi:MAG: alpha/beta hydrolase [Lachnospiraceae bacterium]|nr:alpha/beta hydrolase [Lachnospiraceae bacterium]